VDAFSYLSVLLSIILGLGLTQLLTAGGRLIRHREHVHFDWLPLLWAMVLAIIYVQVWWSMFGLRYIHDWTFLAFLAVLAQTAMLYMMAAVALPEEVDPPGLNLATYYDRHHRWFFGFFLAALVISVIKDVVVVGHLPSVVNLAFHLFLAAAAVVGLFAHRRRYQDVIGVACAAAIAAYVSVLFARLQ
jgi:hypothetical protein